MRIAFNPSTVAALIAPPNNKDITFDLRGHNIFARGVKFCGTDTNTWRDIKINNVSIGSDTLDLRDGDNTTLTNINGVVTINSTQRPVVDNLTSDSTTSSLSANQGRVLKALINGKSDSEHTHDDRYLKLTGGTMASNALITFADSGSWGTDKGPQGARGGLYWTGQSDYAKLYAEETAGDNLDLVIQFGDDNSNGLSIRNASNVQTSYISAGGVITTGTFKGNLDWSYITNKPATATRWPSWDEIANKPNTFTPSDHNHDGRYVYNYGGIQMDGASINKNALGMATNSGITEDWWHILQAAWNGEYRWNSQIAFPTQNRNGMYYRSGLDDNTAWGAWVKLLDTNNYSSTLDSRYYTESEIDSLLDAKLNRQNLSYGAWNPRGYNLAADYYYNGGDLSISESGGQIHVSVDGYFWQNEGQYRVLDTSDVAGLKNNLTVHQYLSDTDTTWYPLIWGGSSHNNTSDSTGEVYKSHDVLSWQTSSQTLYATNIQTNNIKNLSVGGGIYWNPYVESTTDGSDAASITLVRQGVVGGTTLVLSQMNDANDTIQFQTNGSARLYHNSYPILTTQNTYVSNNKGYINGTEITQVNNASNATNSINSNRLSSNAEFALGNNFLQYFNTAGLESSGVNNAAPDKDWWHIIRMNHPNNRGYFSELAIALNSFNGVYWRTINAGNEAKPWTKLANIEDLAWNNIAGKPSSYTPSAHTHSWTSITDKIVAGNEFNIVNAGFNSDMYFNYLPINDRNSTAYINSYIFGNGHQGLALVQASGFVKNGSSSNYVLLGDGGHKLESSLNVASASVASKVYGQVGDTGSHELVRCDMNNDQFRIIAGSNGNNNGWAEIATADDGSEPIYVRQYTGVFSSVVRTLTLLDANGYTHFPSYINIGGNENNNSSPDRVWGSNGSDSYLRSYRTSALRVAHANTSGQSWDVPIQGQHWSRLFVGIPNILHHSSIFSISGSIGCVVFCQTFLVESSHAGSATIICLFSGSYTQPKMRALAKSDGTVLVDLFWSGNDCSQSSSTQQMTINVIANVLQGSISPITSLTNDDTIPSEYSNTCEFQCASKTSNFYNVSLHTLYANSITVNHEGSVGIYLYSSSEESSYSMQAKNGKRWVAGADTDRYFVWNDTVGYQFNITNSGNVGIGTTNPSSKLTVNGIGSDRVPVQLVNDLRDSAWSYTASFLAPNLTNNHNNAIFIGKAHSTCNSFGLTHMHIEDGSVNNYAALEVWGVGNVQRWYYDRHSSFLHRADFSSLGSDASYMNSALQIREHGYNGVQADTWANAPRMSWHWSGRVQTQIGLGSNNELYLSKNNFGNAYKLVYETGTWGINISGNAASAGRANYLSGHGVNPDNSHPGHGARVFYSWNTGCVGNSSSGYSNGITIGSHPNDTSYGFQIVQNMWDDRTYTRRYNGGWQSWKTLAWTSDIPTSLPANGGNADTVDGYHASDFASSSHSHNYAANENYGGFTKSGRLPISGFYQSEESESGGNAPWSSWMHLINCQHSNTNNNYALQIAAGFFDNNTFKIRVTNNDVNNDWRDIIHSGNIGSQSVNYANSAGNADTATNAYHLRINSANTWSTWYWAGQSGQPSWLWGSNDGTNMYVWDPNNFNVNTAQYLRSLGNQNCQTGRTQNYGDVYSYNTRESNTGAPTSYTSVIGFGRGAAGTVEIAGGWCNTHLYWRSLRDCCDDWYSWRAVLDSSNYTEFMNNYYWANVKISTSANTQTQPSVNTIYANNWFRSQGDSGWYNESYGGGIWMNDSNWIKTYGGKSFYCDNQIYSSNSIKMGNILLEHTDEINSASGLHLNYRTSNNVSLCQGGGNVGIGTMSPSYKLDVNGQMRASGFHHSSMDSNNYMLLAGGGYKSFGGDSSHPIFLGYLNLDHGNDGTISSSFYCLGYSVSFTYTRGGNYCRIYIPDTSYQTFYIRAATASVNYSGGGMDTWVGTHRGNGAWWLHCYASGTNEVRVKGFCQNNSNNDSWWGGNPLGAENASANKITVCIFGYVTFK